MSPAVNESVVDSVFLIPCAVVFNAPIRIVVATIRCHNKNNHCTAKVRPSTDSPSSTTKGAFSPWRPELRRGASL